jgi:D-alanine--poly(phosphoribitol) ligase subunit 2
MTEDPAGARVKDVARRVGDYVSSELLAHRESPLSPDEPLLDGLLDSIALMELVAYVEDEFGVAADAKDMIEENFGSVARIARYVDGRIGSG